MSRVDDMKVTLPYVSRERLRDGSFRYRYRRNGKKVTLRGEPTSEVFLADYHALEAGNSLPEIVVPEGPAKGSLTWLVSAFSKAMVKQVEADHLSPLTMKNRMNLLTRAASELDSKGAPFGDRSAARMNDAAVLHLCQRFKPSQGETLLKAMRAMFVWAMAAGLAKQNPAALVKLPPRRTMGFVPWTIEDLTAFTDRHPPGTKAHLGLMIYRYTICRRSDAIHLGPQHLTMEDGELCLSWTQTKGRENRRVTVPVPPPLEEALRGRAAGDLVFLTTEHGKPYTVSGYGQRFKAWCKQAGIDVDGKSAHGIRGAVASAMADGEASEMEIASALGHSGTKAVVHYVRARNAKKLARSAMQKAGKFN